MKARLVVLAFVLAFSETAAAQNIAWEPANLSGTDDVENLYVSQAGHVYAIVGSALYRSVNQGGSWTKVYEGFRVNDIIDLPGGGLIAGKPTNLLKSTDGSSWSEITTAAQSVQNLARDGNKVYAGGYNGELWVSTDGSTWTVINQAVLDQGHIWPVRDLFASGNLIVYKQVSTGLWVTRNAGQTWTLIPGDPGPAFIVQDGSTVYLPWELPGKDYVDIARTTDFQTYTYVGPMPTFTPNGVAIKDNLFVVSSYVGPYVSLDGAQTWTLEAEGLEDAVTMSAAIDPSGYIYVGTSCCVQRSSHVVATASEVPEHRSSLGLEAPYPNPFHNQSTLVLRLDRAQQVRLAVYNVLGQRVQVIENAFLTAGEHRYEMDAGEWPAGLYFVRAEGEDGTYQRQAIVSP